MCSETLLIFLVCTLLCLIIEYSHAFYFIYDGLLYRGTYLLTWQGKCTKLTSEFILP